MVDIVGRHDKASGAAAQRGRPARRAASGRRGDHAGWLRLVALLSIFVGLVAYIVVDPPQFKGFAPQEPIEGEFVGAVRVVDGDTVFMRGKRLRLIGIDAPEWAQTCTRDGKSWNCGEQSSAALAHWIGERILICLGKAIDKYGRSLVRCTAGGSDVAAWMVGNGWALADPVRPAEYKEYEDQARRMRQGIWSGEFIPPWEWRAAHGVDDQ